MILELSNNIEKVTMSMGGIVQICGTNVVKKERIIDSLKKYFSTSKTPFEENQYNKVILSCHPLPATPTKNPEKAQFWRLG